MPLTGVRVLDLSTAMAAPYSATMLAELGATVIKLEKPRRGDLTRYSDKDIHGEASYFIGINRGKLGLTVDLRTGEGQEIVRRMVPTTDVIIENYRPGMMDSWQLGYSDLVKLREDIIFCSVTAYGDAEGFSGAIGNDMTCQGYSGIMDLTGEPTRPPQRVSVPLVDAAGAFNATIGILGALYRRLATGRGEHVKVSLIEAAFSLMPSHVASVLNADVRFTRMGSGHPRFAPYEAFECRGGQWLVIGSFHNDSWHNLCTVIGRSELVDDPRFIENWDRVAHKDELHTIVGDILSRRTRDEWVGDFEAADVPCAPVLSINESLSRFSAAQPGFVRGLRHDALGTVKISRPAFQYTVDPLEHVEVGAPSLGSDTDMLLHEVGYSDNEIASFRDRKII
jgi:crotonobetainyl-CoA:carnitine CoA-transferase CaiB-like acyl-CoA transferase